MDTLKEQKAQKVKEQKAIEQNEGKPNDPNTVLAPPGDQPNEPLDEAMFKVGDVVLGMAAKKKDKYNNQQAEIIDVLSKYYKVKMLSGEATGTKHKYQHNNDH